MKKLFNKIISSLIAVAVVWSSVPVSFAQAAQTGFVNPVDISYPVRDSEGFIVSLDEPLPEKGADGFINELDVKLLKDAESDFILNPGSDMPVAEENGFLLPLEREIPAQTVGFMKSPSKELPKVTAGSFIGEIGEPLSNAKKITTAEELALISSGRYVLGNDIDLSSYNGGNWLPINPTGSVQLDGQGHKITGLNIPIEYEEEYAGLFGKTLYSIKIVNLGLEAGEDDAISIAPGYGYYFYAGGFVACGNAILNNCYSNVPIRIVSENASRVYAGGLLGESDGTLTNCYYYGEITNNSRSYEVYAGGLLGSGRTAVTDCVNLGSISGASAGGLVGNGGGSFVRCINEGDFKGDVAGGLIGRSSGSTVRIYDCRNSGDYPDPYWSASIDGVGGLVGMCEKAVIDNSLSTGKINTESYGNVGGLVGRADSLEVTFSYNTGNINYNEETGMVEYDHSKTSTDSTWESGGIAGSVEEAVISDSWNSGIICGYAAGGIIGTGKLTVEYCANYGAVGGFKDCGGIAAVSDIRAENCINNGRLLSGEIIENREFFIDDIRPKTGGIVGSDYLASGEGYVKNCVNNGNITVVKAAGYIAKQPYCGGISGYSCAEISYCINNGDMDVTMTPSSFNELAVGGISAGSKDGDAVTMCINNGDIISEAYYAGGIVAECDEDDIRPEKIENCINNGKVVARYFVCGIGVADEIINCVNKGVTSGTMCEGIGSAGIIYNCGNKGNFENNNGTVYGISRKADSVSYCYNEGSSELAAGSVAGISGEVTGDVTYCCNTGSFVLGSNGYGITSSAENIKNCFNGGNMTGATDEAFGIGKAKLITNCKNSGSILSGVGSYAGIGSADNISYCVNEGVISSETSNVYDYEDDGAMGIGYATGSIFRCINDGDVSGVQYGRIRGIGHAKLISECRNGGKIIGTDISGIGNAEEIRNCRNNGNLIFNGSEKGVSSGIGVAALIYNCGNTGDISGFTSGGITAKDGTVTACSNTGKITGEKSAAGILFGNGEVTSCYNTGAVSGNESAYGLVYNASSLSNSANRGPVNANQRAGGLCYTANTILNCYNEGYVDGTLVSSGITHSAVEIINTFNTGSIYADERGTGLATGDFSKIINCYNAGNISVSGTKSGLRAGGIAIESSVNASITDSYNSGSVYVYSSKEKSAEPNLFCAGIVTYVPRGRYLYMNNVKNYGSLSCNSNHTATVGGICAYASSYYETIGDKNYEFSYLLIDKDTKNSGSISYNCYSYYKSDGELFEYVNKGAIVGDGFADSTSVEQPSEISLSGASVVMKGRTVKLEAKVLPESGVDTSVLWASDDPTVATVSSDGTVTGVSGGETVISATTVNGLSAFHNIKVMDNAIEVHVRGYKKGDEWHAYNLEGAEVIIGGVAGYTDKDGIVIFDRKNLPDESYAEVFVSAGENYKTAEDKVMLLASSYFTQRLFYSLEYKTEPIYIEKATFTQSGKTSDLLNDPGITAVPFLDKNGQINEKSYTMEVKVDWHKCTENTSARRIYLKGKESGNTVSLNEGSTSVKLADSFEVDEPIILVAETLDNEGNSVSASKEIPLLVKLLNVKIEVPPTPTESLDKIYIMDDLDIGLSLGDLSSGAMDVSYKNGVLKVKFEMGDEEEKKFPLGAFKGKSSIKVALGGALSIPVTDPEGGQWSGEITASVSQSAGGTASTQKDDKDKKKEKDKKVKLFEHRRDMLISGVPCFFSFGLSAGASATIGFEGPYDDITAASGEIKVTGGATIKGGVGGKVTDNFQAEFGPKGTLEVELPAKITLDNNFETKMDFDPSISGSVAAELIVKAYIVDIKSELELGSFKWNKNGIEWDHFLKPDSMQLLSMEVDSVVPVGREYKQRGGGFAAGEAGQFGLVLFGEEVSSGREEKTLYSNIIRCADAEITVIDGVPVLIFTEDNLLRDEMNGLTAVYSVYENGGWSYPLALYDDGTSDSDISSDGKFAAWENTDKVLTEGYTLSEILSSNEISVGVNNGSGYEAVTLTDNNIYDFGAKVKANGDKAVVAWLSNTEADISGESGITSLHRSNYDGEWSEPVTVENIGSVTNLTVSYDGDIPVVAYKNSDCDFYTLKGEEASPALYAENVGRYAFGVRNGETILSYFDEEGTLHIMNNGVEVKSLETGFIGSENPVIAVGDNTVNIFWLEADGIYYTTDAEGEWSGRLCFLSSDDLISDLDCVFKDGENYILTYLKKNDEQTDLMSIEASLGKDIILLDTSADEELFASEGKVKISATLLNNGEKTVKGGRLIVYENDTAIKTVEFSDEIIPGAQTEITALIEGVDNSFVHEYTLEAVCDGDYHSLNNEGLVTLGRYDMEITDSGFLTDGLSNERLFVDIRNCGTVPSGKTLLKIYTGEEGGEPVETVELGSLLPGEEAPFRMEMKQDPYITYNIVIESEGDFNPYNNRDMISYDRIEERKSVFEYDKEKGTLRASLHKDELTLENGKLIWAFYSPGGILESVTSESFASEGDVTVKEKQINAPSEGSRIRVMLWSDFASMTPGLKPLDLVIK